MINIRSLLKKKLKNWQKQHPYNISISHKHKFVWYRVAKNGTRTILNTFNRNNIILDINSYKTTHDPSKYQEYYKFAVARNPYDRLVSCWFNKILRGNHFRLEESLYQSLKDFPTFVKYVAQIDFQVMKDAHLRPQVSLIDINEIDYLVRMETFESDLTDLFRIIGLNTIKIYSKNRTRSRSHYSQYYTEETIELVRGIYKKDIQVFGYQFKKENHEKEEFYS